MHESTCPWVMAATIPGNRATVATAIFGTGSTVGDAAVRGGTPDGDGSGPRATTTLHEGVRAVRHGLEHNRARTTCCTNSG
jgi:hypothetical protein